MKLTYFEFDFHFLLLFFTCRAKELGHEVMNDLRRKEIEKWGSRVTRA
jgi:hypothetical protein